MAAHTIPTTRTECVHFVPPTKLPSRNSGMNQDFFYFILKQTKKKKKRKTGVVGKRTSARVRTDISSGPAGTFMFSRLSVRTYTPLECSWQILENMEAKEKCRKIFNFFAEEKKNETGTGQKNVSCTVVTNDKCCHSLHHYLSYWVRILFFFFQKILLRVYFLSLFIATAKIKESMWAVVWDWNLKIKKGRTGTVK